MRAWWTICSCNAERQAIHAWWYKVASRVGLDLQIQSEHGLIVRQSGKIIPDFLSQAGIYHVTEITMPSHLRGDPLGEYLRGLWPRM